MNSYYHVNDWKLIYTCPNYFSLAYFKAAFQLFEADYYVKADDDIYLRPGILRFAKMLC